MWCLLKGRCKRSHQKVICVVLQASIMYGKQNKCCFVHGYKSTSVSTANKIFVTVPRDYQRMKKLFKAPRRDMPKSQSLFFCCEDHLNSYCKFYYSFWGYKCLPFSFHFVIA